MTDPPLEEDYEAAERIAIQQEGCNQPIEVVRRRMEEEQNSNQRAGGTR